MCGGRHPRGERADFEADFGADIGFRKCRGIPDVDGMRIIRIDGCRLPDVFLPQKILQFRAKRSGNVVRREAVDFFVELVLLTF